MTQLTMLMMLVATSVTLVDWRRGFLMCVVVGIAQDPLRKIAPGQPVYYVVLVAIVLLAALLRAHLARVNLAPSALGPVRRDLATAFGLFLALVAAQALHSFVAYGSLRMTGIGLLVWLTPIPAVVLAYQFALRRGFAAVRRWMLLYCACSMIALSGVYLEYIGFEWATLGEVGEGLSIFDLGVMLKAYCGFFRSSEIAAWHTAAVACMVFTLSVGKRATLMRVASAIVVIAVLIGLGLLTGRRKMLMEILIFLGAYGFLYSSVQRGASKLAISAVLLTVAGYVLVVGVVKPDLVDHAYTKNMQVEEADQMELRSYALRGQSVFADVPNRVMSIGIAPLLWTLDAHGWLGAGLGSGSQGAQEVADKFGIHWGAAEGGMGKIALELGLPGVPILLWLMVTLARQIKDQLLITASLSREYLRISFGLIAFLVANAATFSIATQAFSDPFILILIGWSLGFLFAMPVLALRKALAPSAQRLAPFQAGHVRPSFAPALPAGHVRR